MIQGSIIAALSLSLSASGSRSFSPATALERIEAIGPTRDLPDVLRSAFDPGADFAPLPAPKPGDWLSVHPEPGQTFEEFVHSNPNRPDKARGKMYLQPIGEFPKDRAPSVETLREFAAIYFAIEVVAFPALDLSEGAVTSRRNPHTQNRQLLTGDLLALLERKLPPDAFCLLGITMEDLYPDPSWNFVFGQASLRERVGVYSFARYDPAFYGEQRGADYANTLLRRSGRVLVHETGHMFGLAHCIYFRCVLNGSNHLDESDARPLHLCPVCLRKLQYSIGFDVPRRYGNLAAFYQRAGFADEAEWVVRRLKGISGGEPE